MKNFNRGGGFSDRKGGGNFGRRDSGSRGFNRGGDDAGRPTMHKAICADCGNSCEVPFKPSGDRPVLCSNCFKGKDSMSSNRSGGRDFSRSSFGDKKMFKAVCADCGNSCEVPFQPSSGKPVYCSNCFAKGDKGRDSGSNNNVAPSHNSRPSGDQFELLNAKLDKILQALSSGASVAPIVKKEIDKKAMAPKAIVAKVAVAKAVAPKKVVSKVKATKVVAPKKAKKK